MQTPAFKIKPVFEHFDGSEFVNRPCVIKIPTFDITMSHYSQTFSRYGSKGNYYKIIEDDEERAFAEANGLIVHFNPKREDYEEETDTVYAIKNLGSADLRLTMNYTVGSRILSGRLIENPDKLEIEPFTVKLAGKEHEISRLSLGFGESSVSISVPLAPDTLTRLIYDARTKGQIVDIRDPNLAVFEGQPLEMYTHRGTLQAVSEILGNSTALMNAAPFERPFGKKPARKPSR